MFGDFRILDLSVPLKHQASFEPLKPSIQYDAHEGAGLAMMESLLGVRREDLVYSDGLGWAVEEVTANTHAGTHVDAPYHYHPVSEGRPARRIDEVPLEWCFAPGVVIDVRHLEPNAEITVADLGQGLERAGHALKPRDIVMLHTGCDLRLDTPDYFAQPGLGREGTLWLVEQGVKVIGIDAYTLDRPFQAMVADYKRPGTAATSGPRTSRASPGSIARSRNWPTCTFSPAPPGSGCPASRCGWRRPAPGGAGRWP